MMSLARFELNFDLVIAFLKKNLGGTNILSSLLINTVDFKQGEFFAFLPINIDKEHINQFEWGGIRSHVRDFTKSMILDKMFSSDQLCCIFDDVTSSLPEMRKDSLFANYGLFCENEVYYLLYGKTTTLKSVTDCFYASNAIWHSLCILTRVNFTVPPDRKISEKNIQEFCENVELILVGAYDEEGYVFWEKKQV